MIGADEMDMETENSAEASKGQTGIKRNRPVQSCSECRRRKTKCDRATPCSACILRNDPQSCREYQKISGDPVRHDEASSEIHVRALSKRVRQLENSFADFSKQRRCAASSLSDSGLSEIRTLHDEETSRWPYLSSLDVDHARRGVSKGKGRDALPFHRAPSLEDHNAALAIEDIALNRTSNKRLETLRASDADHSGPDISGLRQSRNIEDKVYVPGLEMQPSVEIADYLLRHFLEEYAWLLRCFHAPTLRKQWEEHSSEPANELNPLDIDRTPFLALRSAIMCTTLYLMEPADLHKIGFDEQQREYTTKCLSDLMEMALLKADWGRRHYLESLQAFIIIGPYWSATGRSDTHYTMLGSAIKVAQTMGLHKLGPELPESATARELSQAFGHKWTRVDRRETGRRIWWLLLELDLNASPEHDFLYSADIGERVCAMPANVNDDELRGEVSITSRPITEHTDMTFICSRLTFLGPLKRFVKAVNQVGGRLTEAIMEKMHEDYMIAVDAFPIYYRTEIQPVTPTQESLPMQGMDAHSMKQITAEARAIKCYGYSAALRLHRLCLAPALRSSSYAVCKEGATRASRWLLEHDPSLQRLPGLPCRWWPFVHGILTASIVLLLNMCYAERYLLKDLELLLRDGISSLRSHPLLQVKQVATLLETLLDQEISKRTNTPGGTLADPSTTNRRAGDNLQSDRTQFRKMVKGALLQREEGHHPPRTAGEVDIARPLLPVDGSLSLAGDQGIGFSVDVLNALLPGTVDGYRQEFEDPLQALLQGADLSILENFLLYPPQSSFEFS